MARIFTIMALRSFLNVATKIKKKKKKKAISLNERNCFKKKSCVVYKSTKIIECTHIGFMHSSTSSALTSPSSHDP